MAKEFKDFDKEFAAVKGTALKNIESFGGRISRIDDIDSIKSWGVHVLSWAQAEVRYAVYEAFDHRTWQEFRVSLKGLSTQEKLYCLMNYLNRYEPSEIHRCRVDNYIGALVRGGCLEPETYEIIK